MINERLSDFTFVWVTVVFLQGLWSTRRTIHTDAVRIRKSNNLINEQIDILVHTRQMKKMPKYGMKMICYAMNKTSISNQNVNE